MEEKLELLYNSYYKQHHVEFLVYNDDIKCAARDSSYLYLRIVPL